MKIIVKSLNALFFLVLVKYTYQFFIILLHSLKGWFLRNFSIVLPSTSNTGCPPLPRRTLTPQVNRFISRLRNLDKNRSALIC